ncbi:hypothetical protein ASD64_01635 [Mesorhizobium sp. Root157]|uniref:tetratricopeptide repeat protein n=1 Tax=Mesorhizobium sp. Root157 TaxID=1736477 RepID=UPI0006FECC05|nr:tetratricopeptide repeat protein [Mesorhizobium sp. Root157]KRA00301.1 hypothetical protein ASD64_01635 [Mesorhizobium sp. Root157]
MKRRLASALVFLCACLSAAAAETVPAEPMAAPAPQAQTPIPQAPATPASVPGDKADKADKADKPIVPNLPQPSTTVSPGPLPSADGLDPARFGARPADEAYGAFQRGLYKTAYNLALPRAQNGDPAAQTLLAEILARGLGVPVNAAEAAKWYAAAAERGVPEAQFQYALMLLDGRFVKKDEREAHALMQAAAEAGNALAQFNFAQLLVGEDRGDAGLVKAVPYYERAAEAGVADAQYAMSQIYANGAGGKAKDDAQARQFLARAARQNYDTAQLDLGQWLIEGRGGQRDLKAGFGWMLAAARGGNVAAQNRLGKLYMGGIGTEPDSILAGAWYIVARRAGLIDQEMEDFLHGLTADETKQALQRANRLP